MKLIEGWRRIDLPACVDMKYCTFFVHNTRRIRDYGIPLYKAREVSDKWNWMLMKTYDPTMIHKFQVRETSRAFVRADLEALERNIEWHNGLKFVTIPNIPFDIPFAEQVIKK